MRVWHENDDGTLYLSTVPTGTDDLGVPLSRKLLPVRQCNMTGGWLTLNESGRWVTVRSKVVGVYVEVEEVDE